MSAARTPGKYSDDGRARPLLAKAGDVSERVERGKRCGRGEAALEVEGGARVSGRERVASAAVVHGCSLDLLDRVHGERARPVEPELVSGPLQELQECVAVAPGAVAEVRSFPQGPRLPRQLAALDEELGKSGIAWRHGRERADDSRSPVTPLCSDRGGLPGWLERRRPLSEAAYASSVLRDRRDGAPLELAPPLGVEQAAAGEDVDVSGEPVCRPEDVTAVPVDVLVPQLIGPLRPQPIGGGVPGIGPCRCLRPL